MFWICLKPKPEVAEHTVMMMYPFSTPSESKMATRIRALILPGLALIATAALVQAAGWRGEEMDSVLRALGEPNAKASMGTKEIWTYNGQGTVYFRDGEVDRVHGNFPPPATESSETPQGTASSSSRETSSTKVFRVPRATIITQSSYRTKGSWGGESDGKMIGVDGKPLADHHIYANDCFHFALRMSRGLKELEESSVVSRVGALRSLYKNKEPNRLRQAQERYLKVYGHPAQRDKYYAYATSEVALGEARKRYEAARANINYKEQLRVKDRINLNQASSEEGRYLREEMKKAIRDMGQARDTWLSRYRRVYVAGRAAQGSEFQKAAAAEIFATVRKMDTQLFAYRTFERTPMARGLAEAARGGILMSANPIFLPAGARVQVLETREIEGHSPSASSAISLRVSKIKVKTDGMRQHDGRNLPEYTLQGWVLDRALRR